MERFIAVNKRDQQQELTKYNNNNNSSNNNNNLLRNSNHIINSNYSRNTNNYNTNLLQYAMKDLQQRVTDDHFYDYSYNCNYSNNNNNNNNDNNTNTSNYNYSSNQSIHVHNKTNQDYCDDANLNFIRTKDLDAVSAASSMHFTMVNVDTDNKRKHRKGLCEHGRQVTVLIISMSIILLLLIVSMVYALESEYIHICEFDIYMMNCIYIHSSFSIFIVRARDMPNM